MNTLLSYPYMEISNYEERVNQHCLLNTDWIFQLLDPPAQHASDAPGYNEALEYARIFWKETPSIQ